MLHGNAGNGILWIRVVGADLHSEYQTVGSDFFADPAEPKDAQSFSGKFMAFETVTLPFAIEDGGVGGRDVSL